MVHGGKNTCAGQCITWVLLGVVSLSQPLLAQDAPRINSQTFKAQQAQRIQSQRALPAPISTPSLIWQSRQRAAETLKAAGLNLGRVIDDGQNTSVVIEQTVAPGTQVAAGSIVGYTVRRPTFVLTPNEFRPEAGKTVHFDAVLVPALPNAVGTFAFNSVKLSTTYTFTFYQKEGPDQPEPSQSQRETKPATDYTFKKAGSYFAVVSATVNGTNVASDPLEIQVQSPKALPTPTPTATPRKHVPTPTPTRTRSPEPVESPSVPAEPLIQWPVVLKAVVLLVVVLGTIAMAHRYYKRKNSRVAIDAKVKISTGNRQIKARIMEPQSLKSRCLTRVRWVRGPLFKTMSPQEKIVKKKGAAHG
jgi:hypothetical protein